MTDQSNLRFGVTTRENSNIKRSPLLDFGAACFLLLRMRQADKTLHDLHWLDKSERLLENGQEQCIRKSYLDHTFKIFYKEISSFFVGIILLLVVDNGAQLHLSIIQRSRTVKLEANDFT